MMKSTDYSRQDPYGKNCVRISPVISTDKALFTSLLETLARHRDVFPQITLFVATSHPPMKLEDLATMAGLMKERMALARSFGFESGINLLSTIGHHEENLDNSLNENYTRMTNIHGLPCMGSFCPNDKGMQNHMRRVYHLIGKAEPDYIWIDDDVRCYHMPVGPGCFCDTCLDIFAGQAGRRYTRAELEAAFRSEEEHRKAELGKLWLRHNRDTIARLFRLIEESVTEASPGRTIDLGFMTGERYYEGYGFAEEADILSGGGKRQVFWRPGGGAYNDERLYALIEKSHQIGRQVSLLPPHVRLIQSEIENFPYQFLKKSPAATALEALSHIAAGCTGAAYNILPAGTGEGIADFAPMLDGLVSAQPFLRLLAETNGRRPPVGICPAWNIDLQAACGMAEGGWCGKNGDPERLAGAHAKEIWELGLPAAYSPDGARVATLCGDAVKTLNDATLERLLSGGVYMDAMALENLNARGYAELTGFRFVRRQDKDCIEQYTDHPINGGALAGTTRNGMQAFHRGDASFLELSDPKAAALSRMVSYNKGEVLSECTMGIFENRLGGRVCVAGYYPWEFLQSSPKARQIKNLFRYLSRDTLPAYVESYHRMFCWVRELAGGKSAGGNVAAGMSVALINASLEYVHNAVLLIRRTGAELTAYNMACEETACRPIPEKSNGAYTAFAVPPILFCSKLAKSL
jgi:hypothetical protein